VRPRLESRVPRTDSRQGLDENIQLAYGWLVKSYNAGVEIYIFGFSRGALTARALAGPGGHLGHPNARRFDRRHGALQPVWYL
jgi:uncharacterized protein (DUF2235 family)